jgi:GH25 family lysozyme M1 (1,4-beta-N-acetylmuramidase)
MKPFLDVAGYQYAGFRQIPDGNIGFTFTVPPNIQPPDLTKAKAHGIAGVISRACNGADTDPTFAYTVAGCRNAGIADGLYGYLRPSYSGPEQAANALLAAAASVGGVLVCMADCEQMLLDRDQSIALEREWAGRRYADWLHAWLWYMEAGTGRKPIIYTGQWWWDRVLADCGHEFVGYDFVLANYPHQPKTMAQPEWPPVPLDANTWHDWATTTQGGDPGSPGPILVKGIPHWEAWQFSSWAKANDYGFTSGGRLDCNVAKPEFWEKWTKRVVPTQLTMPPTTGPGSSDFYLIQLVQALLEVHLKNAGDPLPNDITGRWTTSPASWTTAAVKWFQGTKKLPVTGVVGPVTWEALWGVQ